MAPISKPAGPRRRGGVARAGLPRSCGDRSPESDREGCADASWRAGPSCPQPGRVFPNRQKPPLIPRRLSTNCPRREPRRRAQTVPGGSRGPLVRTRGLPTPAFVAPRGRQTLQEAKSPQEGANPTRRKAVVRSPKPSDTAAHGDHASKACFPPNYGITPQLLPFLLRGKGIAPKRLLVSRCLPARAEHHVPWKLTLQSGDSFSGQTVACPPPREPTRSQASRRPHRGPWKSPDESTRAGAQRDSRVAQSWWHLRSMAARTAPGSVGRLRNG